MIAVALLALLLVHTASAANTTPAPRPGTNIAEAYSAFFGTNTPPGPGQCMVDRFNSLIGGNKSSLGCTSNDVKIATISVPIPTSCILGSPTTQTMKARFVATAATRWDAGAFISLDPGGTPNVKGGNCWIDLLASASTNNNTFNLTGGFGPFYNGELTTATPTDTCGDIQQGQDAFRTIGPVTFPCQDLNNNGTADVNVCSVWNNSGGTTPSCTGADQITANTTSKCTCALIDIAGLTTAPGLTVIKHVVNDNGGTAVAGAFTMSVSGTNVSPASFAGSETGTGVGLSAGSYSVTENGPSGYTATYSTDCSGTISNGQNKTCTVTNNDVAPTLKLVKSVTNNNGGTNVPHDWTLTATGSTLGFSDTGDSTTFHTVRANVQYALTESTVAGYNLTGWSCTGGTFASPNLITLGPGQNVACTATNDDVAPTLKLVKSVTNNSGGTNVPHDWTLTATGSTLGFSDTGDSTTFHTVQANVQYALTESTVASYNLTGWNCTGGGTFASPNLITLGINQNVTCTATNDDNPAAPSGATAMSWAVSDSLSITGLRTGAPNANAATVKFTLYPNGTCTTATPVCTETVTGITSATIAKPTACTVTTGTYSWQAVYSGDNFNQGFTAPCEVTTIQ